MVKKVKVNVKKDISVENINLHIREASDKWILTGKILKYLKFILNNNLDLFDIRYLFERIKEINMKSKKKKTLKRSKRNFRRSRRIKLSAQYLIDIIIKKLFMYYRQNKKNITLVKTNIFKMLIDYFFVFGKSKIMINNMIQNKMWSMIDLINNITPITYQDINLKIMNEYEIESLNNLGIYFTENMRSLFLYNKAEFIIKYIEDNELFTKYISFKDLCYVKDSIVLKYLIDNNMISLKKNDIKKYHSKCKLFLVNYLIENNLIDETLNLIKLIFKKDQISKIDKKDKNINYHRRYMSYRKLKLLNANYNKNALSNEFKNYISKYISLVNIIPNIKCVKNCFMFNKCYNEFIDLIGLKEEKSFSLESREQYELFNYCAKIDDLDKFKILLDKKIIMITDLHKNIEYMSNGIKYNATKICKYMIDELKIKYINYTETSMWGWSLNRVSDTEIIKNIRFMHDLGIPLVDTLLTKLLKRRRSVDLILTLINDFGYKINKSHMEYIKCYSFNAFKKLTKNIDYNKKTMILSLLKINLGPNSWRYSRYIGAKNKIAFNLIAKLNNKEKEKLLPKYISNAIITNNFAAAKLLKQKFNIDPDYNLIKTLVKDNKIKQTGCDIINMLISPKTAKKDINNLKKYFDDSEISSLFMYNIDRYSYFLYNKKNIKILKKLKLQIEMSDFLKLFNNVDMYYESTRETGIKIYMFSEIIKLHKLYKDCDEDFFKNLTEEIASEPMGIPLLLKLNDNDHDFIKYITGANINSMLLYQLTFKLVTHINIITNNFKHLITPYTYKIICTGLKACKLNQNRWTNVIGTITSNEISQLQLNEKRILEEDYEYLKSIIKPKHIMKNFKIIPMYEPVKDEIPEDLDAYMNININLNMNNDDDNMDDYRILNDIDKALVDAQININDAEIDKIDDDKIDDDEIDDDEMDTDD